MVRLREKHDTNLADKVETILERVEQNGTDGQETTDVPGLGAEGSSEGAPVGTGDRGGSPGQDDSVLEGIPPEDVPVSETDGGTETVREDNGGEGDGPDVPGQTGNAADGRPGTSGEGLVPDGGGGTGLQPGGRPAVHGAIAAEEDFVITDPDSMFGDGPKAKFGRNKRYTEVSEETSIITE